jgi:hypothetical protein
MNVYIPEDTSNWVACPYCLQKEEVEVEVHFQVANEMVEETLTRKTCAACGRDFFLSFSLVLHHRTYRIESVVTEPETE